MASSSCGEGKRARNSRRHSGHMRKSTSPEANTASGAHVACCGSGHRMGRGAATAPSAPLALASTADIDVLGQEARAAIQDASLYVPHLIHRCQHFAIVGDEDQD